MSNLNQNQGVEGQQPEETQHVSETEQHQTAQTPATPKQPATPQDNTPQPQSPWRQPMPPQWPTDNQPNQGPQPPQIPNAPGQDPNTQYSPNRHMPQPVYVVPEDQELRRARNYVLIANICGPVSLFIGGMLLAGVGLIFAILGMRKFNKLAQSNSAVSQVAKVMKRTSIISIVICAVAFALNAVTAYIMFPEIMNMVQSGDYGSLGGAPADSPSGATSTWG